MPMRREIQRIFRGYPFVYNYGDQISSAVERCVSISLSVVLEYYFECKYHAICDNTSSATKNECNDPHMRRWYKNGNGQRS
jgi:hypothetical protein